MPGSCMVPLCPASSAPSNRQGVIGCELRPLMPTVSALQLPAFDLHVVWVGSVKRFF
jgi:hypothetical protein